MKRVLFLTNYPSPYRVRFFDELGKTMDVTVLFSIHIAHMTHRDPGWFISGEGRFQSVQLRRRAALGNAEVYLDVLDWLRKDYDAIVVCGYAEPTVMLAMAWLKGRGIPFYMEVDGGLIRQESRLKGLVKRTLVGMPTWWLTTGKATTAYLTHYGAVESRCLWYPFSSLGEAEIAQAPADEGEKDALRRELGLPYKHMVLAIGQFIPRKGFDILLQAAASLPEDVGICIVGGEPTQEYLDLREKLRVRQVRFLGFQKKETLAKYYRGADVFVLPTREDIWGLVINEAMAFGLPVITTDKCVAGLELVEEGVNGYLIPVEDPHALADRISRVLEGDLRKMGQASLERIRPYTIESMARVHREILEQGR